MRFNERIIRDAVRTFVWRRFVLEQKALWAAAAVLVLLFAWLIASGDRSWPLIVTGTGAVLPLLFVAVGWRLHLSASLGRLRAMPEPEAEFVFDEQSFRVTSGAGEMKLPWTTVTEAWARPDFWMLHIAPNRFLTLPTQNMPPETLERLRDWLGGKMTNL